MNFDKSTKAYATRIVLIDGLIISIGLGAAVLLSLITL
jgi:hypothetical protein